MLFAEAVTFDTGDVIAILAILTLVGLAFIAGLAGVAYLVVTVTRGVTHRAETNGEPDRVASSSGRRTTRLTTVGICAASVMVGVAVLGLGYNPLRAGALPAAVVATAAAAFGLTVLTSGRGHP